MEASFFYFFSFFIIYTAQFITNHKEKGVQSFANIDMNAIIYA